MHMSSMGVGVGGDDPKEDICGVMLSQKLSSREITFAFPDSSHIPTKRKARHES